jgi:hypothetical protein
MPMRPLAAGLAVALLLAVAGSATAADAPADAAALPFVNGFCLAIVAAGNGVDALRDRLQVFGGRAAPSGDIDQMKPIDMEMSGQLFRFAASGAPAAIVDPRRGACSLVFGASEVPAATMAEIRSVKLPVGPDGAMVAWRPVVQYFAGRPRPPKYFLQFGEPGGFGVCAEMNSDLRRRDQSLAAMISLYGCRIGKDERLG